MSSTTSSTGSAETQSNLPPVDRMLQTNNQQSPRTIDRRSSDSSFSGTGGGASDSGAMLPSVSSSVPSPVPPSQDANSQGDAPQATKRSPGGDIIAAINWLKKNAPKLADNEYVLRQIAEAGEDDQRKKIISDIESVIRSTGIKAPNMGANAEDEGGEAIDFNSSDEKRSRALEAAKQAGRRKLY